MQLSHVDYSYLKDPPEYPREKPSTHVASIGEAGERQIGLSDYHLWEVLLNGDRLSNIV